MHGTFRSRIERGAVTAMRFDAPAAIPRRGAWRSTGLALLAGCCLAALPSAPRSVVPTPVRSKPAPRVQLAAAAPLAPAPKLQHSVSKTVVARLVPVIRIVLPAPKPVTLDLPSPTALAAAVTAGAGTRAVPDSAIARDVPAAPVLASRSTPVFDTPVASPLQALRPVDIAQISNSDGRSLRVPQLREPGLAAGGEPSLATKIAAMQVSLPPPVRLREADRAALLAEAPTRMTVRLGTTALGKVDFRMTDARAIDVQLGSLLDVLAGQFDSAEFARLRASAAADAYVSFDQLRALGLTVRYDPVYDELRVSA